MSIEKIGTMALIAVVGVLLIVLLRQMKTEYGLLVGILLSAIMFCEAAGHTITLFQRIAEVFGGQEKFQSYIGILFKMIAISMMSEFSVNVSRDAGCQAIAGGIEVITKVLLCMISLPVLEQVIELILGLSV